MNKLLLAPALLVLLPLAARAQVGIGTATPDAKAALELKATDKGLLIPRLTAAQRTALTGVPQGLLVYQTDGSAAGGAQTGFWYYGGSGGWVFLDASAGSGLTLPFSGSYGGSSGTPALDVSHTNGGVALRGAAPTSGVGVYGSSSTGSGVYGTASGSGGYGVRGATTASNSAGLFGSATGTNTYGVIGGGETGVQGQGNGGPGLSALSTSGPALQASKSSGQTGRAAQLTLAGTGNDSTAVYVSTAGARPALRAVNSNASGQAAIRGVKTAGINGSGVEGVVTSGGGNAAGVLGNDKTGTSAGNGVLGLTTTGFGVQGKASGSNGWGVYGAATDSYGVIGESQSGSGVYGSTTGSGGSVAGVTGANSATAGYGVLGSAPIAVRGASTGTNGLGVWGTATGSVGQGVFGQGSAGAVGIEGNSTGSGRAGLFTKTGSSSGAVVEIRQAGTTTDPALVVQGNSQVQEVNTAATGTANLLPVAYGRVGRTGTILGGTGNFTVVQTLPSYGVYVITISNLSSVDLTNAVCQVTCRWGVPGQPNAQFIATANGQANGKVEVHVSALNTPTDLAEADFTFVVYRP